MVGPKKCIWRFPEIGGTPQMDGFISWKIPAKWVMTGGTPILGNPHIDPAMFSKSCQKIGILGVTSRPDGKVAITSIVIGSVLKSGMCTTDARGFTH